MDEQFDLRELLQLGDEVSFEIKQVAHKEKKVNAINVNKLSKGTIAALQSAERGNYRGTIHTLPGESSWRSKVFEQSLSLLIAALPNRCLTAACPITDCLQLVHVHLLCC